MASQSPQRLDSPSLELCGFVLALWERSCLSPTWRNVAEVGLELRVSCFPPPESWDYKCQPPHCLGPVVFLRASHRAKLRQCLGCGQAHRCLPTHPHPPCFILAVCFSPFYNTIYMNHFHLTALGSFLHTSIPSHFSSFSA